MSSFQSKAHANAALMEDSMADTATYGFRCAYCDADLETGLVDGERAGKFAQEKGWRITFGFSSRWGSGAHNTCPDCLPLPGSKEEVLPIYVGPR